VPVSIPPAFRAAEIALVAIKQNRCSSWADLEKKGIDPRLTDDQLDLIHQEMETVKNLQVATGKPVTVTYCPECGRMAYFGTGTVPAKCTLKFGCKGAPVKASATKKKVVVEEAADPLAEALAAMDAANRAEMAAAIAEAFAAQPDGETNDEGASDEVDAEQTDFVDPYEEY
jgi:hypothetical protein